MLPDSVKPVHMGIIGAGMISGAYLDALTTRFEIIQLDAIGVRTPAKAKAGRKMRPSGMHH